MLSESSHFVQYTPSSVGCSINTESSSSTIISEPNLLPQPLAAEVPVRIQAVP